MEVINMTITQAERIRTRVLNILQDNHNENLEQINDDISGIQYIKLKKLLSNEFTDGAVTGALNTITERLENIHKIKTKSGTYFYFSETENNFNLNEESIDIIYSKELEEVIQYSKKVYEGISNILKNTSKDSYYSNVTNLDLDNLRKILDNVSHTENLLKNYKVNKAFEIIENKQKIKENNAIFGLSDDQLPF